MLDMRRFFLMAMKKGGDTSAVTKTVYTQSTAWTTDTNGNASNFANTYCNSGDGLYLATITNNTATGNYKAISAMVGRGTVNGVSLPDGRVRRYNGNSSVATSTSFYISAGATITVYYASKSELEAL